MPLIPTSTNDNRRNLKNINILILNGSTHAAKLFKNILSQLGFTNLYCANDAAEGTAILKAENVDLIFVDWDLRVSIAKNGLKSDAVPVRGTVFTERLRQSILSPNPYIPVILSMDDSSPTNLSAARDCGINETITRPLKVEDLCARISSLIDNPRAFIKCSQYKGPCRRRTNEPLQNNSTDRRRREILPIRRKEQ